jgi:transposase
LHTRRWWCALDAVFPVLAADGVTDVAYRRARAEQAEARGGQSEAWVMELSELVVQAEVRAAELAERLTQAEERAAHAEVRAAELGEHLAQAEARAAQAETHAAQAEARAAELGGQVAELGEQVTVLSRLLYGEKSEKAKPRPAPGGGGGEGGEAGQGGGRRRRGQQPGGKGHGRRDYSRLETREEVHDVPEGERVCPHCGKAFELLGAAEDSEQVDWRVTVTRIIHRRLRYRRRCDCPGARTVTAPVVPKPVPKGRFTAAFLARLLFEKYVLGMPLHRTARALAAEGLEVPDGTLCGALREVAPLLAPLEQAVAARNAEAAHLHADETGWRVFEQVPGKDGHRWWLWVFLAPDTAVFAMDPHRSAAVLERHLGIDREEGEGKERALPEGRHLLLSSDFFTVYQALGRVDGIDPLWCLAHVRRYFVRAGDAYAQLRPWREVWLRRIGEVYVAHRALAAAAPASPAHTRAREAYHAAWAALDTARRADAAIFSLHPAAKKVLATLDHEWEGLVRHRDHPDLDLDNNAAERALRTPVVGRKNYYGNHATWSAHLAARVWTVTATAERNGREPLAYLTAYLEACATAGGKAPEGPALEEFFVWRGDPDGGDAAGHPAGHPGGDPGGGPHTGALP